MFDWLYIFRLVEEDDEQESPNCLLQQQAKAPGQPHEVNEANQRTITTRKTNLSSYSPPSIQVHHLTASPRQQTITFASIQSILSAFSQTVTAQPQNQTPKNL